MSRLLAVLLILVATVGVASAQEKHQFLHNANPANPLFECNQNTMGQMGCQAGNRCKCVYSAFGSAMQGLPPGYHWDCGLTYGNCMSDVPATTSGSYGDVQQNQQQTQPTVVPYQVK